MALALPDNGEVNNREVAVRRLTSESGGIADFEEDDEDEYEHHGELQNGEYDEEDAEPGRHLISGSVRSHTECWPQLHE